MKIIHRYVLTVFFPIFFLTLLAFLGIYLIIDFFEKVDTFLDNNIGALKMISYFLYKSPFIVSQGIPIAALLASLISLGILNRNREIIAMKAAGLNSLSYAGPILAAALMLAVVNFGIGETVARALNKKAQDIWRQDVTRTKSSVRYGQETVWFRGQDVIYESRYYNHKEQSLERVTLFFLDDSEFKLNRRIDARRLRWKNGHWVAENGVILTLRETGTTQEWFKQLPLDLREKPEDFGGIATIPDELDWFDLYTYAEKISQEGYNATPYYVELHLRLALPATTFVLSLLGLTIALRQSVQGGIAASVGIALIVAFVYLCILQVGCSMATAELLPAFLGVWAGNGAFAIIGAFLWITLP